MKKALWMAIILIMAVSIAGCGGDSTVVIVPNVVRILSDQPLDGDITRDAATGGLTLPTFATSTQNVVTGIVFDQISGAEISESRGFLHFSLTGSGIPVDPARITFAKVSVFVNSVTPAFADPFAEVPFIVELMDTAQFPAPIVSTDFDAPFASSKTTFFRSADGGNFVDIDITSLLQDAVALGLNDFELRIRFDRGRFQTDPTTVRGVTEIDDADDIVGHRRADFAPILHVEFL